MKTEPLISEFNQSIQVEALVQTEVPDGSMSKDWQLRYSTPFAKVTAISNNQGFSEGVSEKDSYYMVVLRYHPDTAINISDRIVWGGKRLAPVGDCVVNDFGAKKYYSQKVKYTSV